MVDTIRALREDGYDGFFSLEPHLSQAHSLGGFSGPDLFTRGVAGVHRPAERRRHRLPDDGGEPHRPTDHHA